MATKRKTTKKQKKTVSKTKKASKATLSATLYAFVEPANKKFVQIQARKSKVFRGNTSAYVNALIAKKRGVSPTITGFKAFK